MSDDQIPRSEGCRNAALELTAAATLFRMMKCLLGEARCTAESREAIAQCLGGMHAVAAALTRVAEFVAQIGAQAQQVCEKDNNRVLQPKHVLVAIHVRTPLRQGLPSDVYRVWDSAATRRRVRSPSRATRR